MNCLLYARVSTDKQAQKDLSIPAQIAAMKEHAQKLSWKVRGHFIDEGESGKTANRPALKELINHCKEHKDIDVVLVHKIDRLARNLVDYATIKAILKQKGIRLVSVCEPFEDNPVGNLLENIIASISEWYSANLGEEIKKANQAKLKQGEWPHRPPIGYMSLKEPGKRVKHLPDPKIAPLVQQAFELYAIGNYSLQELAEEMRHRGLKTRYGRAYSPESTKKLLSRRFYIGKLEWNDREHQGKHPPIVANDLFYRVQAMLKQRSADTGEKGKLHFLLRGLSYCKACQQRLTGEVHPRGSYYRCLPHPGHGKCLQPYTPVKLLDNQLEALYQGLQAPKQLLELLKLEMHQIAQRREQLAKGQIKTLKHTIQDLENKELKLLDEMLGGKTERISYEKLAQRYTQQRHGAEARLSQLEVDYKDPLDFLDKCIVVASVLSYLHQRFTFEQRKNLLKAVFERIEVQDKAIVGVKLNPPFSLLLGDAIQRVFKDAPVGSTKEDIFEQFVRLTFNERFADLEELVKQVVAS